MIYKPRGHFITTRSPITADMVAAGASSISETRMHRGRLYWLERRPEEAGRTTIMCHDGSTVDEILPAEFNCRSRVHEYGGGAFNVADSGIYFIDDSDQQIHHLGRDGTASQITARDNCRYTDIQIDDRHHRLVAVEEEHLAGAAEPANRLVMFALSDIQRVIISDEHDFYASPRFSADGERLAWLSWDHPDMPWDNTTLSTCKLAVDNSICDQRSIAGGDNTSIFQPAWHGDALYYVSDQSGWWNLYCFDGETHRHLHEDEAEYGLPQWVFGQSMYCFAGDDIIACRNSAGSHELVSIDTHSGAARKLLNDYSHFEYLSSDGSSFACIAASAVAAPVVLRCHGEAFDIVDNSAELSFDSSVFCMPQHHTIKTSSGDDIYASYYPARHEDDTAPPLIVIGHGGPTGQSSNTLDLKKQFWTTRGFAILDVDYSGSTGYGRHYRERLAGGWGIRDVSDMCDAARAMVDLGLADSDSLIIKGSSAGGYTVLAALAFGDTFDIGVSYYGISDLETLATDTHKFEARYLDRLVGEYPADKAIYVQRSPINHVDQLHCPVLFLQGEEDRVVPRQQAETMHRSLRDKGIPVAYRLYPGEQHGFRRAETIIDSLESELCFYLKMFNTAAQDCGLTVDNLDDT